MHSGPPSPGKPADHPGTAPAGDYTLPGTCPPSLSPGCSLPCPCWRGEHLTVTGPRESVGYVDLTLRALAQFGGGSGA